MENKIVAKLFVIYCPLRQWCSTGTPIYHTVGFGITCFYSVTERPPLCILGKKIEAKKLMLTGRQHEGPSTYPFGLGSNIHRICARVQLPLPIRPPSLFPLLCDTFNVKPLKPRWRLFMYCFKSWSKNSKTKYNFLACEITSTKLQGNGDKE